MNLKRKAASDARQQLKRFRCTSSDSVYEGLQSDLESLSSYSLSEPCEEPCDEDVIYRKSPITPLSTAFAKYPSDLKTHPCPYENCGKVFNRPARLTEHLRSHNNERIFKCGYSDCNKTFLRASHLNHHVKSAHSSIRDYVCDKEGCGKTFVTGSRLRRHLKAHEGRNKYRCTEYSPCNETFRKHSTLQKHIMTVHLNQKPFPCPHVNPSTGERCAQAFNTAGHLRTHEARLHGGARFTCTECSNSTANAISAISDEGVMDQQASFPTYTLLQAHIKTVHPPSCPNCPLICSTARELRRHLEIAHGNVSLEERKVHLCNYPGCERSFTKKGNLTVHINTVHMGEKRFVCGETDLSSSKKVEAWTGNDGCGKRYGSKLALEEHIRTAHLGYKNAKAARREHLGLRTRSRGKPAAPTTLAMLTGEGYVEESGRRIPCLVEQCAHRFYRDYDLWVHMTGKHGLQEADTQVLFMQRAMRGDDSSFDFDFNIDHTVQWHGSEMAPESIKDLFYPSGANDISLLPPAP